MEHTPIRNALVIDCNLIGPTPSHLGVDITDNYPAQTLANTANTTSRINMNKDKANMPLYSLVRGLL